MPMDSALVSCAPRELPSPQALTRSSTERHGQSSKTASRQQCKDLKWSKQKNLAITPAGGQESMRLGLVALLHGLPSDVAAHIFLFSHLADVLHCAGLTCRTLQVSIWQQADFWVSLGGPAFVEVLTPAVQLPMAMSSVSVLGAFRRWVFGINGNWSQNLQDLAAFESPLTALQEAFDRIQGLQHSDVQCADITRLVHAIKHAMERLTASDNEAADLAAALVARCQARRDLFCEIELADLSTTLGATQERALQHKLDTLLPLDDDDEMLDPWEWDSSTNCEVHKQVSVPIGGHTGRCLSLAFLAVMEEGTQEGS